MPITSRKVFQIYKTLDRDQIRFVVDKVIEGSYNAEEWLTRLNRIAFMDLLGDETREQAGRLSLTFGILSLITLFLSILRPVLFFFPVGFLILFGYFFLLFISLLKIDINNNLRIFLVPFLKHLKEIIKENTLIYLKMDFSSPVTKEKFSESIESLNEKSIKIFKHRWIDGKFTLNDGIILEWKIEDTVHQRTSKLVDKAEKMKFKDYEISHLLTLIFSAPADKFNAVMEPESPGNGMISFELQKTSHSTSLEHGMEPKVFMDLLEEAYKKIIEK